MRTFKTLWINLLGVFVSLLVYSTINNYFIDRTVSRNFFQAIVAAAFLIGLYGILFWMYFILMLLLLDFVLDIKALKKIRYKLFIQWLITSLPVLYWALRYEQQRVFFLIAIVSFFITQILKKYLIKKIASKATRET
ncbi:hypothetical protein [Deminuibacter soli]|uniref:Uncharacterized protein n=1 Tax=Deminuibacter soli TaxID=2291815 RepID=A0A3E1NME0_9BACT|nr:hypothetical protein [Deminuibacter soli]RFM29067.1 hypothetical protein DXN05_09930 [Deminuibacter soli]